MGRAIELTKGNPDPWPKSGSSDVALGRLGTERFIAAIEPWHGNMVAIYKPAKGTWQRQMIDDTITDGHAIVSLDVDNDGRTEIVVGQRGGERSLIMCTARLRTATPGRAASSIRAAWPAPAARRRISTATSAWTWSASAPGTANLKWYENVGKE